MILFGNKKKKEEQKKEYIKNFCILLGICIFTILIALFIRNWYHSYNDVLNNNQVMSATIKKVNDVELYNYLLENPDSLVYVTDLNSKNKSFEKKLNNYLNDFALTDVIILFDISNKKDLKTFYEEFNNNYMYTVSLSEIPAFIVFQDGKVSEIISGDNLTVDNISTAIKSNTLGVIHD